MAAQRRERLESLGLTRYQARAYLALLENGALTAADLASVSGVPRTRVYEVCQELEESGLVAATVGKPRRFKPLPVRRLVDDTRQRLRAEEDALARAIPELEQLFPVREVNDAGGGGGFVPLRGRRALRRRASTLAARAEREVLVAASDAFAPRLRSMVDDAIGVGADVRVLHHATRDTLLPALRAESAGAHVRHAREARPVTSIVVDGRECLLVFPRPGPDADASGVWADDPEFVKAQAVAFEEGWKVALPLSERRREVETGAPARTTDLLRDPDAEGAAPGHGALADAVDPLVHHARERLDVALSRGTEARLPWDACLKRFETVQARVLLPEPVTDADHALAARVADVAEVREAPAWFAPQALVVQDADRSILGILAPGAARGEGSWESLITSAEPGLVASQRRTFEAMWADAADLPARPADPAERRARAWWTVSRSADASTGWLREVASTVTRTLHVRAHKDAFPLVESVRREVPSGVDVVHEEEERDVIVVSADDTLVLVVEEPVVRDTPMGARLERVGRTTLTNSRASVRAWTGRRESG